MSNRYISSENIRFDKDFIFTFDVEGKEHRDFDLKFKVGDTIYNEFTISNNLNTTYTIKSGISPDFSAVKKKISNIDEVIKFFNDDIIIYNGEAYKKFNSESQHEIKGFYRKDDVLYIKTDLYSFENSYIIRKSPELKENVYLRPVMVKKTFKNSAEQTQTNYFDTLDNPVNSNESKTYRIIVSDNACLISFLVKEKDSFRVIKNFTYPTTQEISEGKITLEVDNDMKLSNLHFSFFKA